MGREIKRVPLDFDAPIGEVWSGYLMPEELSLPDCPDCGGRGYSARARELFDLWYGYVPFRPEDNGSTPLTPDTPAVRAFAERNVAHSPEFYGRGQEVIQREARRLADLWNDQWSHHVNAHDVAALVKADRLHDMTHTWTQGVGWRPKDPPVMPTPEQVNEWAIRTFGHDAINASVVVRARCEREGVNHLCQTCEGRGDAATEEQRAAHEAWTRTEPPEGEGWQLWETVSEGSPVSPVFATPDELASWMSDPARGDQWVPGDVALKFISEGWTPSLVMTPQTGVVSGVEFIGLDTHGGAP